MKVNVAPLLKQPFGAQTGFAVVEGPIDPHGDNADLLDAGVSRIEADIQATHTNPGALLEGDASVSVSQYCSRCLKPIETPVRTHFAEQYYATIDVVSGDAKASAPRDAKTIGSDFRIDLTPLLREEVILATPFAPLCRPDCRGLCEVCGRDLNLEPHSHDEAAIDRRWAKLNELKDVRPDR